MYYSIKLSDEQLSIISQCLMSGPYVLVSPLIHEINKQIGDQRSGSGLSSSPINNDAQAASDANS